MILDEPAVCARCGKSAKLVDPLKVGDRTVAYLCTVCSEKPDAVQIDKVIVHFRQLVTSITAAVDRHCPECAGRGWHMFSSGRGQSGSTGLRIRRCAACVGTGIDMGALLAALKIDERPKPTKRESSGFSPGVATRGGRRG